MSRSSSYGSVDDYSDQRLEETELPSSYPKYDRSDRWLDNATDRGSSVECSDSDDSTSWQSLFQCELADEDNICTQCKRLLRRSMLQRPRRSCGMPIIEASRMFKRPNCRICRFFMWFIREQNFQTGPYKLVRHVSKLPAFAEWSSRRKVCLLWLLSVIPDWRTPLQFALTNFMPEDERVVYNYHRPQVADASQVKGWITECETQHCGDCAVDSRVGKGLHNLRVIDCECNTVVSAPTDCRYVALSYVWGQHRSDSETLLDPPKTIAHSIQFVRKLGYRYLWIDKYCIDQMDAKDKHIQVLQMGDIYAAAQITFVAAAGKDPNYGLPGVVSETRTMLKHERIGSVWLSPLPGLLLLKNVATSEWASRAWTFQEFYRAKRRLIFSADELIYVCNSGIKHEIAFPYMDLDPGIKFNDDNWLRQWLPPCKASGATKRNCYAIGRATGHLEAYSQRRLTYDADALDAITGALESLRDESVDHVWGVPFIHGYKHPSYARHECITASQQLISRKANNKPGLTPTCILSWINWIKGTRKVQPAVPADLHHTSMALLWYHEKPCRRRLGFPSWSSLGWAGPLKWSHYGGEIRMAYTCNARLHFTSVGSGKSKTTSMLDLELPNWRTTVHALEKEAFAKIDFAKTWPCLELRLKTRQLDIQLNQGLHVFSRPNQTCLHLVSLGLSNDYKVSFLVKWDADPTQLNTPHLKGALIRTFSDELFVMVLAPHGELFERVGLIELPLFTASIACSKSDYQEAFLWRNNPAGLDDGEEKKKGKDFLDQHRRKLEEVWIDIFKDNGPILLG